MDKFIKQLQVEVDTAFLYRKVAAVQKDPAVANVLSQMADIEETHVAHVLDKIHQSNPSFSKPEPSRRAKVQIAVGKIFGYDFIISNLMTIEKNIAQSAIEAKRQRGEKLTGFEDNHLKIIESVAQNQASSIGGGFVSKMEGRHKSVGGNALRAAVLGANDGLVSNMSLVMGVAGAEATNNTILLTGLAGLLAGALSMALGEWLSVQSSRELFLRQIALETEEIETSPEQEMRELALLYQAKGMSAEQAEQFAKKIFDNKDTAIDTLVREELNIDKEELGGSAWEAAFTSFFLFGIGAVIPVIPFFFTSGMNAIYISIGVSILGLFIIGSSITLFTGRSVWFSGLRQVFFGLSAAAITYGIGKLIGVSIAG